jgi:hypothetical protein
MQPNTLTNGKSLPDLLSSCSAAMKLMRCKLRAGRDGFFFDAMFIFNKTLEKFNKTLEKGRRGENPCEINN